MKLCYILILVLSFLQVYPCTGKKSKTNIAANTIIKTDSMKLKIIIGQKTATAILYDNPSSKDFASLLPLTLTLEDYANTEKVSDLPKKLSTENAPAGHKPFIGDITYFAPWGNIAMFYKDFGYSSGLISLGKITNGIEVFRSSSSLTVKIELEK